MKLKKSPVIYLAKFHLYKVMGSHLKYAGYIRYRGSSEITQDQIIDQFSFEEGNYAHATVFFKEYNLYVLQVTTLEQSKITRWRAYIDFDGGYFSHVSLNFGRKLSTLRRGNCLFGTSYDDMRDFWRSGRTPFPVAWKIRRGLQRYGIFLKKIEKYFLFLMEKEGLGFCSKYVKDGFHVYWLCKRLKHERIIQLDKICPASLSVLAYGLREGYFSSSLVETMLGELIAGRSLKKVGLRLFYSLMYLQTYDSSAHQDWSDLQSLGINDLKVAFGNWWKLLQLGTRRTFPAIHISAPLVYFPHLYVPKEPKKREEFINLICSQKFLRHRFDLSKGTARNKEIAILIFKNYGVLKKYFENSSASFAIIHFIQNPSISISRNMNAIKAFDRWIGLFMGARQEEARLRAAKDVPSFELTEHFNDEWTIVHEDILIRNLNTPFKMIEHSEKMRNCLGELKMLEVAVTKQQIFCEVFVGSLLLTIVITPLNDTDRTHRLGNVLGVGNRRVAWTVRERIAKALRKRYKVIF
ncbi:MAG: hypothetical protein K2Q26_03950 [Bdellovibrionales bacterium]|nr:hypothetical protein [Bdellovibrionales bacterium]